MRIDSDRMLRVFLGAAMSAIFNVILLLGGYLLLGELTSAIYLYLPILVAVMIPVYAHLYSHHEYWPGRRPFEDGFLAGAALAFFLGTLYVATTPLVPHDNYHFPGETEGMEK